MFCSASRGLRFGFSGTTWIALFRPFGAFERVGRVLLYRRLTPPANDLSSLWDWAVKSPSSLDLRIATLSLPIKWNATMKTNEEIESKNCVDMAHPIWPVKRNEFKDEDDYLSPFEWWNDRLLHYNFSLVLAGIFAFLFYAVVIEKSRGVIPDAEITIFTIFFQGIAYLFMIGLANLCFFGGPILEMLVKPKNIGRFRRIAYRLGYWFSVLLPFSIPVLLLYFVLFRPGYWGD